MDIYPPALIEAMDDLPVLPAVAARVLSFDDETVSLQEMSHVLSGDPALTAALLKVANSAYYGFSRRLATVREAVLLLGFKQVRQVALGASLLNAFKHCAGEDDGFDLDLFWGHSIAVAVMAETAARKYNAGRPEEAFTAGVLHDIGVLAVRKALPTEFAAAIAMARRAGLSLWDAEMETFGFTHAQVGAALVERWQLPERLVEALARHHEALIEPHSDGLAGVVAFADQVAAHHGVACGYTPAPGIIPARELPLELATLELACGGMGAVLERSHAFIASVTGSPRQWFVRSNMAA